MRKVVFLAGLFTTGFIASEPSGLSLQKEPGHAYISTFSIYLSGREIVRTQWTAEDFNITLVGAHMVYSREIQQDTGYMVIQEILTTPTPCSHSHNPDIIVLGDFNRHGNNFESVKPLECQSGDILAPKITFFDPAVHEIEKARKTDIRGKGLHGDKPSMLSSTVSADSWIYDMFLAAPDVADPSRSWRIRWDAPFIDLVMTQLTGKRLEVLQC